MFLRYIVDMGESLLFIVVYVRVIFMFFRVIVVLGCVFICGFRKLFKWKKWGRNRVSYLYLLL